MKLEYLTQGNCQTVLLDKNNKLVYKIPLSKKSDNLSVSFPVTPRAFHHFLIRQRHYRSNKIRFAESVKILKYLEKNSKNGLNEFFPCTKVFSIEKLQYDYKGKNKTYTGEIIQQEYVEIFFNNTIPLNSFDWTVIPTIQKELWRYGVGICAPADTWGPKNWGKTFDNCIKLVDTSHLTEQFQLVSQMLDPKIMEFRKAKLLSFEGIHDPILTKEYFEYIGSHLDRKNLYQNWRKYLNN